NDSTMPRLGQPQDSFGAPERLVQGGGTWHITHPEEERESFPSGSTVRTSLPQAPLRADQRPGWPGRVLGSCAGPWPAFPAVSHRLSPLARSLRRQMSNWARLVRRQVEAIREAASQRPKGARHAEPSSAFPHRPVVRSGHSRRTLPLCGRIQARDAHGRAWSSVSVAGGIPQVHRGLRGAGSARTHPAGTPPRSPRTHVARRCRAGGGHGRRSRRDGDDPGRTPRRPSARCWCTRNERRRGTEAVRYSLELAAIESPSLHAESPPSGSTTRGKEARMPYLSVIRAREHQGVPPESLMKAIDDYVAQALKDGAVVSTGGLAPSAAAVRVRSQG